LFRRQAHVSRSAQAEVRVTNSSRTISNSDFVQRRWSFRPLIPCWTTKRQQASLGRPVRRSRRTTSSSILLLEKSLVMLEPDPGLRFMPSPGTQVRRMILSTCGLEDRPLVVRSDNVRSWAVNLENVLLLYRRDAYSRDFSDFRECDQRY
jgi:hypothetical protein